MTVLQWLAVCAAGIISLVAPFGVRPMLMRLQVIDVPNLRSSHTRPTLRGGGLGVLLGFAVGGVVAVLGAVPPDARLLMVIVAGGILAGVLGFVDDTRGLGVLPRAGVQLLLGVGGATLLGAALGTSWWWVAAGAVFVTAYINFANFMDGINGISGLHGLLVGCAFAATGLLLGHTWLIVAGLLIAASFAAFLPWNLIPPGLFLGDVGSYLLGGAIALSALAAAFTGVDPVVVIAPLSVYLGDTVTTVVRRARLGEPIFRAHRSHAYQRLTDTGLSHIAASVVVSIATVAASAAGLLAAADLIPPIAAWAAILVVVALYLWLPRLRGSKFPSRLPTLSPPDLEPAPIAARGGFAPRTWVVVGASGFIGSAVASQLRAQGIEVIAVSAPRLELDPAMSTGADVNAIARQHDAINELSSRFEGAEVVVNAAGLATPDAAETRALYGANALLPAVIARAAQGADVSRVIHLSSAAVQGRRPVLDPSVETSPFSPYSRSKALGEYALLTDDNDRSRQSTSTDMVIIRATSVQGIDRGTTVSLRRISRSPLASVALPGDQPTVVSSVAGLVQFVQQVGSYSGPLPPIMLQPWEGLTVSEVLEHAGGRAPRRLPAWLCRTAVACGNAAARVIPEVAGAVRRVELMWFGQAQSPSVLPFAATPSSRQVIAALEGSEQPA